MKKRLMKTATACVVSVTMMLSLNVFSYAADCIYDPVEGYGIEVDSHSQKDNTRDLGMNKFRLQAVTDDNYTEVSGGTPWLAQTLTNNKAFARTK